MVISAKPELYPSLCTILGTEDLEDILEVIVIDAHNARVLNKRLADRAKEARR